MVRRTSVALVALVALALVGATAHAGKEYQLKTDGEVKVAAGAPGKASLTLVAGEGWHMNEEAPIVLTLTPDPGVTLDKPTLSRADLAASSKDSVRFDVVFTVAEAGRKNLRGEAKFVVCKETSCKPVKEKVTWTIEATPAAKCTAGKKK